LRNLAHLEQRCREYFGVFENRTVKRNHAILPIQFLVQAKLVAQEIQL
jgi:hypothetical protein